jgi:cytochrome c oxidase subunit 1
VPGHFHLTVGTASALTFMAITYWLMPQITGKPLRLKSLAVVQPYLWFVGMTLMSNAMHREGLLGVPRRTAEPMYEVVDYEGAVASVGEAQFQIAIGSILLFTSLLLFVAVIAVTWLGSSSGAINVNGSLPEPLSGAEEGPRILDNMKLWFAIAAVLVALAYGLPLYDMVSDGVLAPGSPPIPVN